MLPIQEELIFDSYSRGVFNGYATQSYSKLKNIILYYSDFLSYKTYGYGMSGLAYKAIQFGPVPVRWDRVYSLMDDIYPEIVEFTSGNCGTKLCSTLSPDYNCFTSEELSILNSVLDKFINTSASEISELSHKEDAWKKYYDTNQMIDYKEAFTLQAFDC